MPHFLLALIPVHSALAVHYHIKELSDQWFSSSFDRSVRIEDQW